MTCRRPRPRRAFRPQAVRACTILVAVAAVVAACGNDFDALFSESETNPSPDDDGADSGSGTDKTDKTDKTDGTSPQPTTPDDAPTCAPAKECKLTCDDAGTCDVSCGSASGCALTCGPKSSCLIRCTEPKSCSLDCQGGQKTACPQAGVFTCNRDCPLK